MKYYYKGNKTIAKLEYGGLCQEFDSYMKKVKHRNIPDFGLYLLGVIKEISNNTKHEERINMCDNQKTIFVGSALCDDKDEYSLDTGKKIAKIKAFIKMHDRVARDYYHVVKELKELTEIVEELMNKHIKDGNALKELLSKYN